MRALKNLCVGFGLIALLFVSAQHTAFAATKTWDGGGGDGLWTTAANWNGDTLPASGDDVVLDNTSVSGNYTVTLNAGSAQSVRSVQIGYAGNANTITLIVSGGIVNVLTVNGGGATALHVHDGGVLNNQSSNGTRGILLNNASDVFKMSGSGKYIHNTAAAGSNIPQRTSGTTSANYDFAATSVFEIQVARFDSLPTYGTFNYNINATNSAALDLNINGDLNILQGTLGVNASTSNTFAIGGNVALSSGATLRGSNGTGTATINITGNVSGAGTLQGSTSGGTTTNLTVGGSIASNIAFNNQTTNITFSGGASGVNLTPANSPQTVQNITVSSGKTVTLGSKVTIASGKVLTIDSGGTFALGAELANSGSITVNGTLQINSGGWVSGTAPTYASTSTLKYNAGGTYGRGTEWNATSGAGYPGNVQLSNNTTVDLGANSGTNTARQIAGSLTIDSGSTMDLAGTNAMNAALIVAGDVTNNGTLRLSTNNGGDIRVGGNWTRGASSTFTPNNRAVLMNGSGTQSIAVTGGGTETFNYLILDKSAGSAQLSSSPATDVVVNASSGDALQLINEGSLDLNGRTLTMSGSGGNLKTSGGARLITGASGSTMSFTGNKTVTSASLGAVRFDVNVLVKISAQVGFGGSTSLVKGTLQIDSGGSVANGSAPTYDTTSTLRYNSGGSYTANQEWYDNTPSGAGVPQNVQISNNTALNFGSTIFARYLLGNLTINSGSSLTLSSGFGGNLNVAGNWTNSGTFTPNARTVTFQSSNAQSITGATTFDFLTLSNSNGLTLNNDVSINQLLTFTSGKIDAGSNTLDLGCSATTTGASSTNHVIGSVKKSYCAIASFTYPIGTGNGYSPVAATLTALGTNPSSLQIQAVQSNAPGLADAKSLDRYWSLAEAGDLTTNLTFTYLAGDVDGNESDYRIYRGMTQVCDATCVDENTHTATINNVSQFSNWSMGESNAPTAAGLVNFKAKLTPKNNVRVKWATGSELNILGFNVYRQTVGVKGWVKVNTDVIPATNMGTVNGARYALTDKSVEPGKTYRYKVQVLDTSADFDWSNSIKISVP